MLDQSGIEVLFNYTFLAFLSHFCPTRSYSLYIQTNVSRLILMLHVFQGKYTTNRTYVVQVELVETKHPGHAEQLATCFSTSHYEALLVVSGDGTFHEVLYVMHLP
jgi:hypothetical protein